MKKLTITEIWIIGLAIFSMLFGAGNIMLAINVGMRAGLHFSWANFAFLLSAVVMPIAGLVGVILFNGNYNKFFNRLGTIPGQLLVFLSCSSLDHSMLFRALSPFRTPCLNNFYHQIALHTFQLHF